MGKAKPTPTPWVAGKIKNDRNTVEIHGRGWFGLACVYVRVDGRRCAQGEANAELIVRSVNSYAALLAACEAANALLAKWGLIGGPPEGIKGIKQWAKVQQKLYDAIQLASPTPAA